MLSFWLAGMASTSQKEILEVGCRWLEVIPQWEILDLVVRWSDHDYLHPRLYSSIVWVQWTGTLQKCGSECERCFGSSYDVLLTGRCSLPACHHLSFRAGNWVSHCLQCLQPKAYPQPTGYGSDTVVYFNTMRDDWLITVNKVTDYINDVHEHGWIQRRLFSKSTYVFTMG